MKARFLSSYYAEAGLFVIEEESRYSLNTLHIEPHPETGVVIVATDGHTMGVFHDINGQCPDEGIMLNFNKPLAEICGVKMFIEINDDGSASLIELNKELVRFNNIEAKGTFPDWHSVLPKWEPDTPRIDYNPEYFQRCAEAGRATYPRLTIWSGTDGTQVTHSKERAAVVVEQERDDCFFLVMQMRRTDKPYPPLLDALRLKDETDLVPETATPPQ